MVRRIAIRAERLGTMNPNVLLYAETSVERVIDQIVGFVAERLGAEVNAHTDKDHTAYQMRGLSGESSLFPLAEGDVGLAQVVENLDMLRVLVFQGLQQDFLGLFEALELEQHPPGQRRRRRRSPVLRPCASPDQAATSSAAPQASRPDPHQTPPRSHPHVAAALRRLYDGGEESANA